MSNEWAPAENASRLEHKRENLELELNRLDNDSLRINKEIDDLRKLAVFDGLFAAARAAVQDRYICEFCKAPVKQCVCCFAALRDIVAEAEGKN